MTDLRFADATDAPALAALHAGAFDRPWSIADFEKLLGAAGARALLAPNQGFILWWVLGDEAEVLTFAVAPSFRRQGVGSGLLTRALANIGAMGVGRVVLETATDNAAALALYDRFGFAQVGRRPAYYAGTQSRTDALVLALMLP
jgi:ribosomal-protein-alanine N-acetyltransferase